MRSAKPVKSSRYFFFSTASASMNTASGGNYDADITIASNSTLKDLNVKHYMLAYHLFFSLWLNQLVAAIKLASELCTEEEKFAFLFVWSLLCIILLDPYVPSIQV